MRLSDNSLPPVDKDYNYGEFQRGQRWQDKLMRKLAFKSADIPDDDMQVNVRNGWGWKEMLVAGAIACGALYATSERTAPPPPAAETIADVDTTRSITIEKYIPPSK